MMEVLKVRNCIFDTEHRERWRILRIWFALCYYNFFKSKIMKKIALVILMILPIMSFAQLKGILNKVGNSIETVTGKSSDALDISAGLKEALNKGVEKEVSKLTLENGFYKNEAVKILMPAELQKVDKTLRSVGLASLSDEGIKLLNRAAEDAVKEATPIFVTAIKQMSISDAKSILMGKDDSATNYLETKTAQNLYSKFKPVVEQNLQKVGADIAWEKIISKYNSLPLTQNINPDITDYVTKKALEGVFKMIAVEELSIRTDIGARTSPLLKKVFAMQDSKKN